MTYISIDIKFFSVVFSQFLYVQTDARTRRQTDTHVKIIPASFGISDAQVKNTKQSDYIVIYCTYCALMKG